MAFVLLGILILLLGFVPQLWAKAVMKRHSLPREDLKWTGAELANDLVQKLQMPYVKVSPSNLLDYYDPREKVIHLNRNNYEGRNLTALVTAVHETSHAIQDKTEYYPLNLRNRLVALSQVAAKIGSIVFLLSPIVGLVLKGPVFSFFMIIIAALSMGVGTLVHLITLPVELDASFRRALPILKSAEIISARDEKAAREILKACAFTYLASSLASLVSIWRWLRFLKR